MSEADPVRSRYCGHDYLAANPTWDSEDSPWKAGLVAQILSANNVAPASVADVGCGAGLVLAELRRAWPSAALKGFDVAPDASRFWPQHAALGIEFSVGDFLEDSRGTAEVILLLDVFEHLSDPFAFLRKLRPRGKFFVFHIPLDLSAVSVLREAPLLYVRRKVGHVHYFTKGLALELLRETGYEVIDCRLTGASLAAPNRLLRTRLAAMPRWIARCLLGPDIAARVFGGETLLVLARSAQ